MQAINSLEKIEETHTLGLVYNNLSELYFDKGEVASAMEMLEKAKNIYESVNYPLGMCGYFSVLAYYYTTKELPDYNKVIEYCNKSLLIAKEYGDLRQYADATSFLGHAYIETGSTTKAISILHDGLIVAQENDFKPEIVRITETLSVAYKLSNNLRQALKYLEISTKLSDSILNEEKIKEFTQLDLKFKFEQEQITDSLQNAQEKMKMTYSYENEINTQKQLTYFFIVISLLVIAFAIYMLFARRRLRNTNLLLTEKNTLILKQKTEIENYSLKIKDAYTRLQELDEYKQAFTNMLMHDLKNPLNSLVNIDTYEDASKKSNIVVQTSKQMLRLIMNLLDINKAEDNKMKLEKTEVNLFDIIQSSFQEIVYLCIQKDIGLVNKSLLNISLVADSSIITRVFINLFTNAIKFSPSNGKIIISTHIMPNNFLKISVIDNGPGISKEDHNAIFEKFTQLSNSISGNLGSTGIGLAFCKLAVESHGWTIGVDSEPGKGAEFWILIKDFNIIDDGNSSAINIDNIEKEKIQPAISKADMKKLVPYLHELLKLNVYSISDVKKILLAIKKENIKGIEPWLNKVQLATATLNEEKFVFLIKSLLND